MFQATKVPWRYGNNLESAAVLIISWKLGQQDSGCFQRLNHDLLSHELQTH
jgi:hypothetical protein